MPQGQFESAIVIAQRCARRALQPPPTTFADPKDFAAAQWQEAVTSAGRLLATMYEWPDLIQTFSVTLVPGQQEYDLPADWGRFIEMTGWNTSSLFPLIGPLTPQQYQTIVARSFNTAFQVMYRVVRGKLNVVNQINSSDVLTFEYMSNKWVQTGGVPPYVYENAIQNDADVPMFPYDLMMFSTLISWKKMKGYDYSVDEAEFGILYDAQTGAQTGAQVLFTDGRGLGVTVY